MDLTGFKQKLKELNLPFEEQAPLAPLTTLKIGGPADILLDIKENELLIKVLQAASLYNVPVTMLGWGSNVLIADQGIRGAVIRLKSSTINILDHIEQKKDRSEPQPKKLTSKEQSARLVQAEPEAYYNFADLDYDESDQPSIKVEIDSGTSLQYAINYLIERGITGLQWFSGIPGTIGGAIYNNIHGGSHFIFEFVKSIKVANKEGETYVLPVSEIEYGYDFSRFHHSNEIILKVVFRLYQGDKQRARNTSIEWARRKKLQPRNSAGCTFQNLSLEQSQQLNLKSNGFGYINDKILNLKGKQIGGAKISEKHAAFIENAGNATSAEVLELIRFINKACIEKIGIKPKLEIFLIGFKPEDIADLV